LSASPELLDARSVISYLDGRGVVTGTDATARELGGGISNVVLSVEWADNRVIVKQSLPQLKVESEWFAPVDRVLSEARSIELMNQLLPGAAPRLLDADADRFVIAMTGAPANWTDWKQRLMAGDVCPSVGALLGADLARLHARTRGGEGLDDSFFDETAFEQLRIDPYFRHAARRVPHLAVAILETIEELRARRSCLVHGDFSPKNLLVDPHQKSIWFIDFEVAHFGDPAFDLAFLLSHLTLKAVHHPRDSRELDATAASFVESYRVAVGAALTVDLAHVIRLVGCLLVARVEGKSQAEYLDAPQRAAVLELATTILADRPTTLTDLAIARTQGAP
jgi:5-methylthioribose kinase